MNKYKTPYRDVLPVLTTAEQESLRQRIKDEGGIHDPVLLTEDGEVLDGHNRLAIDPGAKTTKIAGSGEWSESQRRAFVIRSNRGRRNLSPDQDAALEKTSKQLAIQLKKESKTQREIAGIFGVSQPRVSQWLGDMPIIRGGYKGHIADGRLDCRVKIPVSQKKELVSRVEAGESQEQVAADYGVTQPTVSKLVTVARKKAEVDEERTIAAKTPMPEGGIVHADFRSMAKRLDADSVSLVFTDPPYDRKSVGLYGELAEAASRVLTTGGSLIAYAGHYLLPDILPLMTAHLRLWWVCACLYLDDSTKARMREYGVIVTWKPLLWFVKKTRADKETFVNDSIESQYDKSHHEWQQGLAEPTYYIEHLTKPSDLVFDPFCGTGTTAVAAKRLGRRWIACDIDEPTVATARKRLLDENGKGNA